MEIASLILSSIALVCSLASLTWLIAKQISSHSVQLVPVDDVFKGKKAESFFDQFKEIGDKTPKPIGDDV